MICSKCRKECAVKFEDNAFLKAMKSGSFAWKAVSFCCDAEIIKEPVKRTSEEVEDKKKPVKIGGTQSQVKRRG